MTIRRKLFMIGFTPGIVVLGIFLATLEITQAQRKDGLLVNLAGRQRMLSQKLTKELLVISQHRATGQASAAEIDVARNTRQVFAITLKALMDGGPAPTTLDPQAAQAHCPPPPRA